MAHGPLGKVVELEVSSEESEAGTLGYGGGEPNPTKTMKMRRTARRGMMEREEFVGRVRVQLGAKSEEEAVRTVEAYLETLAERLGGFGPYELSEKLPWLEAYPAEGTGGEPVPAAGVPPAHGRVGGRIGGGGRAAGAVGGRRALAGSWSGHDG